MRTIGIVTVSRSDYSIYLPILRSVQTDSELKMCLFVAGTHFSPEFGMTSAAIAADGFEIGERVDTFLASDTPEAIAKSMGLGVTGFSQAYARSTPDLLVVLGDRFEMHAAALAALPFKIPVAHIHGGELTEGAIDDALRHSITKLSHLHFVSTPSYARRVIQLGEEPWRVVVCGAPSLDNLRAIRLLGREELEAKHGLNLSKPFLLATFHPVTLEYERTESQIGELLAALVACEMPVVFTHPNADTQSHIVTERIKAFVRANSSGRFIDSLGTQSYFSLMAQAAVLVGNSSSGIIEAASFRLPVVNIGSRQRGRIRGPNVIDVGYGREEIEGAITLAMTSQFRETLRDLINPYGNGDAAGKIVNRLKTVPLEDSLIMKRFHDKTTDSPDR